MVAQDLTATDEAVRVARGILERARMRPDFANAGDVEMLLAMAKNNYLSRQLRSPKGRRAYDGVLEAVDFDPEYTRGNDATSCRKYLRNKVAEEIIAQLEKLQTMALNARRIDLDPGSGLPMGFIFKGPAGTYQFGTFFTIAQHNGEEYQC